MQSLETNAKSPLALRPREAAEALGVSERTLWSWTKDGSVPHVKLGRTVLYPIDGLRDWLRSVSVVAESETT